MIIDAHIHCSGDEKVDDVLQALDGAAVDKAIVLAPFLSGNYALSDGASLRAANQYLARLISHHTDRLIGFAVINPSLDNASEDLRRAAFPGKGPGSIYTSRQYSARKIEELPFCIGGRRPNAWKAEGRNR